MSYVVSLQGFTPPPRFDAVHWATVRIEESTVSATGPWSTVGTSTLSPVDADPTVPASRSFTVTVAQPTGWYRVVWIDGSSNESASAPTYSDLSTYQSSGVQFSDLVARLRAQTPLTPTEAKARLNQAHKRMVVEGEALKAKVSFGPTVVGQNVYELDPDIAHLRSLRVNGYQYDRKGILELDDLAVSDAYVVGRYRGFFAAEFSAAGAAEVTIYPTPVLAGQTIEGRAIMLPPDLVNDTDYPSLPADYHEDLVDGALAVSLMRDDERLQDGFALEQRFTARIADLRGRVKSRVGGGVARVRLTR